MGMRVSSAGRVVGARGGARASNVGGRPCELVEDDRDRAGEEGEEVDEAMGMVMLAIPTRRIMGTKPRKGGPSSFDVGCGSIFGEYLWLSVSADCAPYLGRYMMLLPELGPSDQLG